MDRKTSKLGKASLLIGITIFLLVVFSIIAMIVMLELGSKSDNVVVGISLIGWILAPGGHFVGAVLGLVDVCRRRSKKLVPSLGIALNAVLGGIGLVVMFYVLSLLVHAFGAFR